MDPFSLVTDRLGLPSRPDPTLPVVLELDLSHGVVSTPPTSPLVALRQRQAPTMRAIRDGLRHAATDDKVVGLLVHTGTCPVSLADADEIGALIAAFTIAKPSIAWTESFGELTSGLAGYRLAVNAGQIWVQPSGALGLTGVQLGITLLRGGLDKLGVEPQFGQRHEYKSAAEQLMATEVSDANREMVQRIADSLLDDTVARVAARRSLDIDAVRAAVAQAPLTARAAVDAGLVDHLGYRDEVYDWARRSWPTPVDPAPGVASVSMSAPRFSLQYVHRYAKRFLPHQLLRMVDRGRPSIAVVDVQGPIVTGAGRQQVNGGQAGSDTVTARLRAVGRDPQVKAVLLRVDSPGGSYVASDAIRREVIRLRESGRPVVATMGAVAASGGYFVSMGASEIVCQPSTLTGSIGVLAGKLVTEQLMDKLGLVHETIQAGPRAAMMAGSAPFTEEQWQVLNAWLDEVYADFTAKAAADRGLDLAELEPLARGRVWTGADAVERRLADHLGGVDLAIDRACALAAVDRASIRLSAGPMLRFLTELKPAESSEAAPAGVQAGSPAGFMAGSGWTGGPDALLSRVADWAGLAVPHGVLSLPFRITIS